MCLQSLSDNVDGCIMNFHSLSLGDCHHNRLWRQNSSNVDRQGHRFVLQCLRHLLLRSACCKYNSNLSHEKLKESTFFDSFSPNLVTIWMAPVFLFQFRLYLNNEAQLNHFISIIVPGNYNKFNSCTLNVTTSS